MSRTHVSLSGANASGVRPARCCADTAAPLSPQLISYVSDAQSGSTQRSTKATWSPCMATCAPKRCHSDGRPAHAATTEQITMPRVRWVSPLQSARQSTGRFETPGLCTSSAAMKTSVLQVDAPTPLHSTGGPAIPFPACPCLPCGSMGKCYFRSFLEACQRRSFGHHIADFGAIAQASTGGNGLARPYGLFSSSRGGSGSAFWKRVPREPSRHSWDHPGMDSSDDGTPVARHLTLQGRMCHATIELRSSAPPPVRTPSAYIQSSSCINTPEKVY
jgi:hypothetical protein